MPVSISGSGPITGLTSIASPTTLNGLTIPTTGFGKVLQVVQGSTSTQTPVASTTFADTSLSATIAPTASSSKILVLVQQAWAIYIAWNQQGHGLKLLRGSSAIYELTDGNNMAAGFIKVGGATEIVMNGVAHLAYLDSPSTTSATTYKTQGACRYTNASGNVIYQSNGGKSTITLLEIAA